MNVIATNKADAERINCWADLVMTCERRSNSVDKAACGNYLLKLVSFPPNPLSPVILSASRSLQSDGDDFR